MKYMVTSVSLLLGSLTLGDEIEFCSFAKFYFVLSQASLQRGNFEFLCLCSMLNPGELQPSFTFLTVFFYPTQALAR